MNRLRALIAAFGCLLALAGCDYVVVPPEADGAGSGTGLGWSASATAIGPGDGGDLRIELTIRNDTGLWSAMRVSSASLAGGDGAAHACMDVHAGTGGHRLAPGMQMRGYVGGSRAEPTIEPIRVKCAGAAATTGSRLALDYTYVTGEYNYYDPDAGRTEGRLEVDLDQVASDLSYPIAEPIEGVVLAADAEITALNEVLIGLAGVTRSDEGLEFTWRATNPGEYPTYVHIGEPPVIGTDGILYGWYESPDLVSVPAAPPGESAEWTTLTAVPPEAGDFIVLVSVESKKQRLFVSHAIDISTTVGPGSG